jgi:gas vesicle protein
MEIKPATIDQIIKGRNGKRVVITNDVGDVARQIKEISSDLELHYNETADYFVVIQKHENGEHLVTTAQDLDGRIVERVKQITNPQYNFDIEAAKVEKEAKENMEKQRKEHIGEIGERLAHGFRKDLNIKKNF